MGILHKGECSRKADDSTRNASWQAFLNKYAVGLTDKLPPDVIYFERNNIGDDQDNFNKAIANGRKNAVLIPVNEPFENRANTEALAAAAIAFGVCALAMLLFFAFTPLETESVTYKNMF